MGQSSLYPMNYKDRCSKDAVLNLDFSWTQDSTSSTSRRFRVTCFFHGYKDSFHSLYCHDSPRTRVEGKDISALPNHKLQMLAVCQVLRKAPPLSGGAVRRCNSLTKSTVCRFRLLIANLSHNSKRKSCNPCLLNVHYSQTEKEMNNKKDL